MSKVALTDKVGTVRFEGQVSGVAFTKGYTVTYADLAAGWTPFGGPGGSAIVGTGYTPDVGDVILDVFVVVNTAFDDLANITALGLNCGVDSLASGTAFYLDVASGGTNAIGGSQSDNSSSSLVGVALANAANPNMPRLVVAPAPVTVEVADDDVTHAPPAVGSFTLYFLVAGASA